MASKKELESMNEPEVDKGDAPPSYARDGEPGTSSATTARRQEDVPSPEIEARHDAGARPTIENPFDFPSDVPLPAYSEPSAGQKPVAIPQVTPNPTSAFIPAYAPALLGYGVTEDAWLSLIDTLSAFLAAKVSDRALRHAGDMARRAGQGSTNLVKGVGSNIKSHGKSIGNNLKRGNILGAAFGVVGGTIGITVGAAVGTAGAALRLPGDTAAAILKKPKTPRDRAITYLEVVNKKWLSGRGLNAQLVDSNDLAQLLGMSTEALFSMTQSEKSDILESQLVALEGHIEKVKLREAQKGELGAATMWLIVTPIVRVQE